MWDVCLGGDFLADFHTKLMQSTVLLVTKDYKKGSLNNIHVFVLRCVLDFYLFIFYVLYSALLHLPALRFHCVGGCWDRIQDCCDFGIGSQTL